MFAMLTIIGQETVTAQELWLDSGLSGDAIADTEVTGGLYFISLNAQKISQIAVLLTYSTLQ